MRKIKCSDIVQDMTFYPRCAIDWGHVEMMTATLEAGGSLPAVVICGKSKKLVDGFHRLNAVMRHGGADAEIDVIEKDYASQKEMFLDAIRYNAKHGQPLSRSDRAHCLVSCRKFDCDDADVAKAIGVSTSALGPLTVATNSASLRPARVIHQDLPEPDDEPVSKPTERPSGDLRAAEVEVLDAAVKWQRATNDDDMDKAIDGLAAAVQHYLTVKARKKAP